jgi:hypothetical protein
MNTNVLEQNVRYIEGSVPHSKLMQYLATFPKIIGLIWEQIILHITVVCVIQNGSEIVSQKTRSMFMFKPVKTGIRQLHVF